MSALPKVVFFGSDAICLPVLHFLVTDARAVCELVAVVSQPDRPKGRGRKLTPNPAAAWAKESGIRLFQPEKPDPALVEWIREEGVAVALVMAYGHFLGRRIREAPEHGMLNFHGSLLPKYRGASPVETAVAAGDSETGVCLMKVEAKMDTGAVADVERVRIEESDTATDVRVKVGEAAVPLLRRNLSAVLGGGLEFKPQDESLATCCRKLSKEDALIDFSLPAKNIVDRFRGFFPWPGTVFDHGEVRVKVGGAAVRDGDSEAAPGTVVAAGEILEVATGEGIVGFTELQRPGGRMLPTAEFLRGHAIEPGVVLSGGVAESLVVRET